MAKKLNYIKSGHAVEHKKRKREEAEARQKEHDLRMPEQQLALISQRPGESLREMTNLNGKIAQRKSS